jgi:hypothetical protein
MGIFRTSRPLAALPSPGSANRPWTISLITEGCCSESRGRRNHSGGPATLGFPSARRGPREPVARGRGAPLRHRDRPAATGNPPACMRRSCMGRSDGIGLGDEADGPPRGHLTYLSEGKDWILR